MNFRVANFSSTPLSVSHELNLDLQDIQSVLREIRRYNDLPYVYLLHKAQINLMSELLAELRSIRSTCYPHALFILDGAELNFDETDLDISEIDIIHLNGTETVGIVEQMNDFAKSKFHFDPHKLRFENDRELPEAVDVVIVGAGVTGLYAANKFLGNDISFCVADKRACVGGIWSKYANSTSQVNTSEAAYRLVEKKIRSNRDHSTTREILEDIVHLSGSISNDLFLETEVEKIEKVDKFYLIHMIRNRQKFTVKSKGLILAINDRVGAPREIVWKNQDAYGGKIISGISDATNGFEWKDKKVAIIGMGAFAIENARTALESGAGHVTVICRRHGTVCPKIIDYLNFTMPYYDDFKHDNKSNIRNMLLWKKLYDQSGATQPECWMGKIKHDGHTISVSDLWFIAHYLKKLETVTGTITGMYEDGVIVDHQHRIDADVVVNCVGFHRNASTVSQLTGYDKMYNNNYIDKDFMYLADAYIDDDAFNSLFGSSVLEMVKFYLDVYLHFFDKDAYYSMIESEGVEKISIKDRKWSHYIAGASSLMKGFPQLYDTARSQVSRRTSNFMEAHDLENYIIANEREWVDTHSLLAGKPMKKEACLPYAFQKLVDQKI
jgi:cation diffusion facilitator CzcD-associated flavoprotein CzcO